MRHHRSRTRRRRGALLLEMLIAVTIFVSAGLLVIGSVRTVRSRLAVARDTARALDLACSKMAELEAGLVSIEALDGAEFDTMRSGDEAAGPFDETAGPKRWRIEAESEPSEFGGLALVTLRVIDQGSSSTTRGGGGLDEVESAVLRQFVQLRDIGPAAGDDYESDEALRALEGGR